MRIRIQVIFVLCLILSEKVFALIRISKGTHSICGKVVIVKSQVYLIINEKSNSEISIHLVGPESQGLLNQNGSNGSFSLKLNEDIFSRFGEAQVLKVERLFSPFENLPIYSHDL